MKEIEELITLKMSKLKRLSGALLIFVLGTTLLFSVYKKSNPGYTVYESLFLLVGLILIFVSWRIGRARLTGIKLTKSGIYDLNDVKLCAILDINYIDRRTFAIKPANGFIIHLKNSAKSFWIPGLCWRIGKRLAIGGMLSKQECKAFANLLEIECGIQSK